MFLFSMEKPDKRRKYDAAFQAEALRVARESRSTQAATRALNLNPKLRYKWRQEALCTLLSDPAEAAEVRQLTSGWLRSRRFLKKAIAVFGTPPTS